VDDLEESHRAERRVSYHPAVSDALRILVVDDEDNLRHLLGLILGRAGYRVITAANGREALARLDEADVVLCDVRMPDLDGLGFLDACPKGAPPVIMMSAYGTVDTALEAIRRGAYDYVSKPFKADEIVLTLRKLEERERLAADRGRLAVENARLHERSGEPIEGFVGRSPPIQEVLRVLVRAAPHDTTVLLTGESGTGKELLARALHRLSPRAAGPWVAINCAAIPEALLESELFGHTRGAFTGAVQARPGLFEQADKGTLFLDEIGDLPLGLQAKLLRVLQEGTVRRLGARADQPVDVRIVAATAQPLDPPGFRQDLYYRLAVVRLHLPPLRERPEDLPLLVEHLLAALATRMRLPRPVLAEETLRLMLAHPWPGNVRQLENALERALLVSDGRQILPEDLPAEIRAARAQAAPTDLSIPAQVAALERTLIARALEVSEGNKSAAARALEISYKTLLYKIREYGLEP
jgi:two-component system response regulator AtoC